MYKKYNLLITVFLTGICSLVIEIVGIRMLSPFFGNTMYTVSSVVSVFLAALSFGYYYGGILADKKPLQKVFYFIITLSGICILSTHLLSVFVLPFIGYKLTLLTGPFVSAVILFLLPGFFLGMISPFAIKLQNKKFPKAGVGTVAGEIFFWSTFGSIFGSLITGFVLIPYLGIDKIVIGTGTFLTLLGLIPLSISKINEKLLVLLMSIFVTQLIFLWFYVLVPTRTNALYQQDGVYERLSIVDGKYHGKPVRFFYQDRSNSGAMSLNSDEMVYDFSKFYNVYKVFNPNIKNALVIGAGPFSIPKALHRDKPSMPIDVVDIEPSLYELSKQYFKVPNTRRIRNHVADGRRFLHDSQTKYDYIFSDVYYTLISIPSHFTTKEFFRIAKSKLNNEGMFVAHVIGNLSGNKPSLLFSEVKTFQEVFPNSYVLAVKSKDIKDRQSFILVGYNSSKKIDWNNEKITQNKDLLVRSFPKRIIDLDKIDFSSHLVFTDNYAPIDHFSSEILRESTTERKD